MLSFFPRGILDEILNLIESVSEGFPSYSPSRELSVKTFPLIYLDASVRIWTHRDGRNHSLKFETDLYNTIYFCIKVLVLHIYLMLYNFGVYQPITSLPSVAL